MNFNCCKNYLLKNFLLFFLFVFSLQILSAQNAAKDTTAPAPPKKPYVADYSYLRAYGEHPTHIFGEIRRAGNPSYTSFFPKTDLFCKEPPLINNGAKFEVMNDSLPAKKTVGHMLVKIISNPPANEHVGEVGWVMIEHTSLQRYYDNTRQRIDTNYIYNKYVNAGNKCRADAENIQCPVNKKCNLQWAAYFDCMMKGSHDEKPAPCPMPDCSMEDCPGDKQ